MTMRGVIKVILIGNATRAAELRHTQNGKPVSNIHLAINRKVNGQAVAQFHTIVCWDTLAETTSVYVKTGDPLYVEGRLEHRSFQDVEGKERGVCEIIASDVSFLSRRPAGEQTEDASASTHATDDISPDDFPF